VHLLFISCIVLPAAVSAQTAAEIIKKNIAAKGGEEKLRGIQSITRKGVITLVSSKMTFPVTSVRQRPNLLRSETLFQNKKMIDGYDGTTAWAISPMLGGKGEKAVKMPAGDAQALIEEAQFDHPFLRPDDYEITLVGSDSYLGEDVFVLKLSRSKVNFDYYFINSETWLEMKKVSTRVIKGKTIETTSRYKDYKNVNGILVAHRTESRGVQRSQFEITSIVFNKKYSSAYFAMPSN